MTSKKVYSTIEVCELTGVDGTTLRVWFENEWIAPVSGDRFDEEDLARIHLIRELQEDFGVNEEGLPVILHLLDQIYCLREQMRKLAAR